jgi:two-component system sensor histidine kinase KdpD
MRPAPAAVGYVEALILVALSTGCGMLIAPHWGTGAVDLIYLPAVLAVAVLAGRGPALLAAVLSALAYNYFFTAPQHTLRIHDPSDVVTVVVLFAVALVTSHLTASIRREAESARAYASRNATIAGFARRLLACSGEAEIAAAAVGEIAALFDCNAALLSGRGEPCTIAAAPAPASMTPSDIAAAAVVLSTGQATGRGLEGVTTIDWQIHPVRSKDSTIAAMALARNDGVPPVAPEQQSLLSSLLDQVALALGRAQLEGEARDFATVRERDRLRLALLSSIGEDLKPRVAAIADAAGQLRRAPGDKAPAGAIAAEAAKLQRYLDNLLELGPASDEQPFEIGALKIDLFSRSVSNGGQDVHLTPKEFGVLAELAKYRGRVLSHAHLLKAVWGPAQERQTEYLRVAVRGLRQKLERDPKHPAIIINEPAIGYRLVA